MKFTLCSWCHFDSSRNLVKLIYHVLLVFLIILSEAMSCKDLSTDIALFFPAQPQTPAQMIFYVGHGFIMAVLLSPIQQAADGGCQAEICLVIVLVKALDGAAGQGSFPAVFNQSLNFGIKGVLGCGGAGVLE